MKKHLSSLYQSRHISMTLFLLALLLRCNGALATRWPRSRECNISRKLKLTQSYSLTGERRNRFKHCGHKHQTSNGICQDLEVDFSPKRKTNPCNPVRHRKEWHSNRPYFKH